jgi:DNA-binding transcriptional ArsR family regulator
MGAPEQTRTQMWVTTSPLRFRIFELLREGPATASILARRLGESSGTTSYHLRLLEKTGAVVEDPTIGTKRERWWRRVPEKGALSDPGSDVEGRAIAARYFTLFFERDAQARSRFVTEEVDDEWHEAAFAGNWIVRLTTDEARELGAAMFALIDEYRGRSSDSAGDETLVSFSILPWLE